MYKGSKVKIDLLVEETDKSEIINLIRSTLPIRQWGLICAKITDFNYHLGLRSKEWKGMWSDIMLYFIIKDSKQQFWHSVMVFNNPWRKVQIIYIN